MIDVDQLLDTWMLALHGQTYPEAYVLRLATLGFCGTLPTSLSSDLQNYPEGNTSVEVRISARSPEDTPENFQPSEGNLLEKLLCEFPKQHISKISIPKKFILTNHMGGISILPTLAGVYYNAEMTTLMPGGKNGFEIELYSKALKRFVVTRIFED